MTHRLSEIGPLQRRGIPAGLFAVCSSHEMVLETALRRAGTENQPIIIESTCNQVNQYGGYSAMTPSAFAARVRQTALKVRCPDELLLIGGDHLGPYPWRHEDAETAMGKARQLVTDCVSAGYGKIHLDCGMCLGGDEKRTGHVSPELSARRTVSLCRAAEATRSDEQGKNGLPLYIIGAEAPKPGGSLKIRGKSRDHIVVDDPGDVSTFLDTCRRMFQDAGLNDAWQRVVGIVVQPGVDFGADSVVPYNSGRASGLSLFHDEIPDRMTFEVHATDFQAENALIEMVADHFALLKCGPALTFAFREAVFALSHVEDELLKREKSSNPSGIRDVIDRELDASGEHWETHTPPDHMDAGVYHVFGFTDRIRYYWHNPAIAHALARMMHNLRDRSIPLGLVSQYLPWALDDAAGHNIEAGPRSFIRNRVLKALDPYFKACRPPSAM